MAISEISRWLRVTIGEAVVKTTADVSISAALDQLNRTCTFTLAQQPSSTPADGAVVLVELVDTNSTAVYSLFGGKVDGGPETESEPFGMTVRAVDQLSDLRIVRTGGDLDLTGMTPKEAKMEIFDYCGLTYDSDDIVDVDYILGALEPVKWLADGSTSAAQVITEIDRVFGLCTETIGNNRIISFRPDVMPEDDTGAYRTLTKGVSVDFQAHHRAHGSRNEIQTIWSVTGVSHEFNDGNCTSTPWAKAVHGTARVGRSRRVAEASDQSDLIQDESLAIYVAANHMRQTSGIPDTATVATLTSRNLHPGTKLLIEDRTYGIRALPRIFCVTRVEIVGLRTDLTLLAGPPGDEGTITSGVDRVCNDTHTDGDIPGDFEPPDFDVPPLDDGDFDDIEFPDIDLEDPDLPDTETRFNDCTESGELVDLLALPWRSSNAVWRYDAEEDETLGVYTPNETDLFYNITESPTPKTSDNDYVFAQGEILCVTGTVRFCESAFVYTDPSLQIRYTPIDDIGVAVVRFYAGIGTNDPIDDDVWGVYAQSENLATVVDERTPPHTCVPGVFGGFGNRGGYIGDPAPWNTDLAFGVCFDVSLNKQRTYVDGDWGTGYHEDLICVAGEEDESSVLYGVCDHADGHILEIRLRGGGFDPDGVDPDCPPIELKNLSLGFATCVPNPDYIDPDTTEGES